MKNFAVLIIISLVIIITIMLTVVGMYLSFIYNISRARSGFLKRSPTFTFTPRTYNKPVDPIIPKKLNIQKPTAQTGGPLVYKPINDTPAQLDTPLIPKSILDPNRYKTCGIMKNLGNYYIDTERREIVSDYRVPAYDPASPNRDNNTWFRKIGSTC